MSIEPIGNTDPRDTPVEPDHPQILDGGVVPGDATLMVRCMAEEMLQIGVSRQELIAMSHDPNYQGLFAARQSLGDIGMDSLIDQAFTRVGRHRHRTWEFTGNMQGVTLTVGHSG